MQIMLVCEIQIFVHQIQPVDFWFNISYSEDKIFYVYIQNSAVIAYDTVVCDWNATLTT